MLILVGVTINIAINGGLFDTARKASQDMQIEADRERLTSADLGSLDSYGYVDFNKLDNNLPDGFTKVGERTYKSAKENVFVVNENGEVINPKLNEYGFYCNMVYETNLPWRWQEETVNTRTILVIDENNNMTISTWADTNTYEGVYVPRSLDDLGGYIVDQQGGLIYLL